MTDETPPPEAPPAGKQWTVMAIILFAVVGGPVFLLLLPLSLSLYVRSRDDKDLGEAYLTALKGAIVQFHEREGRFPESLDGLTSDDWPGQPYDAWGKPIRYTTDGETFTISTLGRDGVEGGEGADADRVLRYP